MTTTPARVFFWHRRDLRLVDNTGLRAAADHGRVIPLFCLDDDLLQYAGSARVSFMLSALSDLKKAYRNRGTDLVMLHGDPDVEIPAFAADRNIDTVVWNEDYSGFAQARDEAVEDALLADGMETRLVTDTVLHEPGSIRTTAGEPYSVFTYYGKKWADRDADSPLSAPDEDAFTDDPGDPIPELETLGFEPPTATVPEGTREAARARLDTFLDGPIFEYAENRDVPAHAGTSRLSQDLKFGLLGIREVYAATQNAHSEAATEQERENVNEFQRQLAWRDFYAQVLAFNPETVSENFKSYQHPIEWRDDPAALTAWKAGETGYPIVDAGMRQLRQEGYIHNRVRMIVASFLTKDLLLDWRQGYRWFREKLIDHDTANDVGGWQWAASTGTDAQPYFRIFNPMTQGERYDPAAEYIREYVEELRDIDPAKIHSWVDLDPKERKRVTTSYPAPIVDHGDRREAAIAMFERARGDD